jgi:hypothetical protein
MAAKPSGVPNLHTAMKGDENANHASWPFDPPAVPVFDLAARCR